MAEELGKAVGTIFDYFSKVGVAAIMVEGAFKAGDKIRIKGEKTDFEQKVGSMQTHNKSLTTAKAGDEVGIKVDEKVRRHDRVYLVK